MVINGENIDGWGVADEIGKRYVTKFGICIIFDLQVECAGTVG